MARLTRKRFEVLKPSIRERSLESLKQCLKNPSSLGRSRLERRSSEHHDESERVWRGSVIDLCKWASDDEVSVFSDVSDVASGLASQCAADVSGTTDQQCTEGPQDQACPSQCPSIPGSLDDSSLNLCHQCAGINIESLSSDLGYEHKLLSELPSRDQLYHLDDWSKGSSTGLCKLCLVFMSAFRNEDITELDQDRYRLLIGLRGVSKEDMYDQDHFDAFTILDCQTVKEKGRSVSRLLLGIMNLDFLEFMGDYGKERPRFDAEALSLQRSSLLPYVKRLHCYTDVDDPSIRIGVLPVRPVGNSTSSAASFEVAAAWLSQCLAAEPPVATSLSLEHLLRWGYPGWTENEFQLKFNNNSASAGVSRSFGPERPTRLLDIGCGPESSTIRLKENYRDDVPYATLSYCWGARPQTGQCEWLTTTKNFQSRAAGMPREELPQTLQDSITVAERLGITHIWIDSLCIIQDSEDDWAVEAAKMGDIYLGSVLTIVAASSNSAEHGCFNQRSASTMQSLRARDGLITLPTSFGEGRSSNLHIITKLPYEEEGLLDLAAPTGQGQRIEDVYKCQVEEGPWTKRAWTLQEHVLSRRVLFYTDQMLLWECDHCRLSEDRHPQMQGNNPYPLDVLGSGAARTWNTTQGIKRRRSFEALLTAETWYCGLVEDYTKRQMTFTSDKLVAIGALAKETSWGRRIPYLAGLWGDSVRYGLMWRRSGPGSRLTTSTCPSWSWASQSSPVSYELLTRAWPAPGIAEPQVLDVHVEPADDRNPFGDVRSGHVILQTKVQTARVLPDFLGPSLLSVSFDLVYTRGLFIGSGTVRSQWPVQAHMDDEDVEYDKVLIALIGCRDSVEIALLLHPPWVGAEHYRRVGIAILKFGFFNGEVKQTFQDALNSDIEQWTTSTIKIV